MTNLRHLKVFEFWSSWSHIYHPPVLPIMMYSWTDCTLVCGCIEYSYWMRLIPFVCVLHEWCVGWTSSSHEYLGLLTEFCSSRYYAEVVSDVSLSGYYLHVNMIVLDPAFGVRMFSYPFDGFFSLAAPRRGRVSKSTTKLFLTVISVHVITNCFVCRLAATITIITTEITIIVYIVVDNITI